MSRPPSLACEIIRALATVCVSRQKSSLRSSQDGWMSAQGSAFLCTFISPRPLLFMFGICPSPHTFIFLCERPPLIFPDALSTVPAVVDIMVMYVPIRRNTVAQLQLEFMNGGPGRDWCWAEKVWGSPFYFSKLTFWFHNQRLHPTCGLSHSTKLFPCLTGVLRLKAVCYPSNIFLST